ncbi:8-amino-7-oxononanoate synthase [Candidatus Liberibacter sp.]|uniref:8-amino-7-oxononanoate synthase n=1 Tax=Candidatus Liberibacter sp. TaxID=34022 RepID=UPI0015F5266F|nr:8-amino-7-oxononanoate synthase [Candidatus Liberibacter sp.]MBA5724133.1 8-amino-7-oxononanoate synthase [Candidatus Liberibacter sp.]
MIPVKYSLYEEKLKRIKIKGRQRELKYQDGFDFSSHDYLSFSKSHLLRDKVLSALESGVPIGSGGSRLLRGNHIQYEELEKEAADFFGFEKMLYFGSGYTANLAVFSTLPQPNDIIVYDELIHASIRAGINSGKAQSVSIPHNDANAFADAISKWRKNGGKGFPWIAVESIYSMDGDIAPLCDLVKISNDSNGFLFVDEAHATGVCGPSGSGLMAEIRERDNLIVLHSCCKALGAGGALVGAKKLICDYLINYAKPFIYTTAPSPLLSVAAREALRKLKQEPNLRNYLLDLISFTSKIAKKKLGFSSKSHIQPIIIGNDKSAIKIAKKLQHKGFDIRAIRPPTVPINTARLRLSITLNVDIPKIIQLFDLLSQIISEETL